MRLPALARVCSGLRAALALSLALCLCALPRPAWCAETQVVRVGMLAFVDAAAMVQQWTPTARALEAAMPGVTVQLQAMDYDALSDAIQARRIDFVFTNPEHFVVLRNLYKLRALATMRRRIGDQATDRFGSVIFARAGLGLRSLADVRGRSVAAVGVYSLGGFLLADDTLRNAGVDLRDTERDRLVFTSVPHTRVVDRVLSGQSDVGIVRTGMLDALVQAGRLKWSDIEVLEPRPPSTYPQVVTTDLTPEWPWAAMPHVDPEQGRRWAAALMALPADDAAAHAAEHAGFARPANYAPVEDLMRRLHTYPDRGALARLQSLWVAYQRELSSVLATMVLVGLVVSAYLFRTNRHLRQLTGLYERAKQDLQMTSAAFDSQVGLIITDGYTRVLRANDAFTAILGYSEQALKGQSTAVLRGLGMPEKRLGQVWAQLQRERHWQGELMCRHLDGRDVPCMVTITALHEAEAGVEGFVGSFVDMSRHHQDQQAIRQLAFFDVLTGLPNRRRFLDELQQAMNRVRVTGQHGALIFIDLDHFKLLNDSHGHSIGDALLKVISKRLDLTLAGEGLVARLGGDEFVALLGDLPADDHAAQVQALAVALRLREAILAPCQLQAPTRAGELGQLISHSCSGSLGVALFDAHDQEVTEVMRRADIAMYQSKHAGRNTIRHFDPEVNRQLSERAMLSADLAHALAGQQLALHYQVQVDHTGAALGAECLLRWQHPTRGMVSPAVFVPLAEESGAIIALGDWVVDTACATLARWAASPATAHLELAVNVSPRQFAEPRFADKLQQCLASHRAPPQRLVLEITEGLLLDNADEVTRLMHRLCELGVSFAIDDFGTGYSSLSYLQRLPLRQLKVDRSFIHDLTSNRNAEAIVRTVIGLGSSLGLTVVAEGVETAQQQALLLAMGCGLLQGYHLGRPVPLPQFEAALPQAAPTLPA